LDPGSEIRDPGSGMGKNQDPGSGINIPDPQHWVRMRIPDHPPFGNNWIRIMDSVLDQDSLFKVM
jgi:hypothetical protein